MLVTIMTKLALLRTPKVAPGGRRSLLSRESRAFLAVVDQITYLPGIFASKFPPQNENFAPNQGKHD